MRERDFRDWVPILGVRDNCVVSVRGDLTFGWRIHLPVAYSVNEAGYDSIIQSFIRAYKLLPAWCVVHKMDVYHDFEFRSIRDGAFLEKAYARHFEGRSYLGGESFLYLSFSSKSVVQRKTSSSSLLGSLDRKFPSPERIASCAETAAQFAAILNGNPLIGLSLLTDSDLLRLGDSGRDEGVIPSYLSLWNPDGPDYNFDLYPDRVEYGDYEARFWYVEDSDAYPVGVSSVKEMHSMRSGSARVFLSGGSPIGHLLRVPHVVNRYVLTLPRKAVEAELEVRRRLNNSFSTLSNACASNASELRGYLDDAARDETITVKGFMDVMAWFPKGDVMSVRPKIVQAFSDLDVSVVEETFSVPHFHYAAIPGNAPDLGYDLFLTSEITAYLCHGLWDGADSGIAGGLIKLCDRRMMVPVSIDIQSTARDMNLITDMNAVVIGPSGTGKSFLMNKLVQDFYYAGEYLCIIDIGDSYEGFVRVVNEETDGKDGIYNTYDPDNPYGFNPFEGYRHWDDRDDEGELLSSGYDFILSLLKTIYVPDGGWKNERVSVLHFVLDQFLRCWDGRMGSDESTALDEALRDAFRNARRKRAERNHRTFDEEHALRGWRSPIPSIEGQGRNGDDPLFDHFFTWVTRVVGPLVEDDNYFMGAVAINRDTFNADAMGLAMSPYSLSGKYFYLLNSETPKELFDSRLTVFEVDRIKDNEDLFPLWILNIMHKFEDKMRTFPGQKVMVIEEAWKAVSSETMVDYLVWLWRTARKFRTSAMVVTQSVDDLVASPYIRDAIINNSSVKILLDQRRNAASFDEAADILGLSHLAKKLVLSVNTDLLPGYGKYKEAFFAVGQDYANVFAVEVSPEQALVFESDKTKKKPLFQLAESTGSFLGAVSTLAEQIRDSNKIKTDV